MDRPAILIFDIETTNLVADFGHVLCISYKWLDAEKVYTVSIDKSKSYSKDPTNDKETIEKFRDIYLKSDMVVAHYGTRFDIRFLNSRCLFHNIETYPPVAFIDTWRIAKYKLNIHSNRLDSIIDFLDIEEKKTPLSGRTWIKARAGDKKALKYVIDHCVCDVLALEAVYKKLRVLHDTHPNRNVLTGEGYLCPVCGGNTTKQGQKLTQAGYKNRYKCKVCGKWSTGPARSAKLEVR